MGIVAANICTTWFSQLLDSTCIWPLAFRRIIKQNTLINMNGKGGHNLDMDEYAETYVVKPLKTYATGMELYIYATHCL